MHRPNSAFFHLVPSHLFFPRIQSGTVRGPRDATVRAAERVQLRHWWYSQFFLQYGLPARGGARGRMPWGWSPDVERTPAKVCGYVVTCFYLLAFFVCLWDDTWTLASRSVREALNAADGLPQPWLGSVRKRISWIRRLPSVLCWYGHTCSWWCRSTEYSASWTWLCTVLSSKSGTVMIMKCRWAGGGVGFDTVSSGEDATQSSYMSSQAQWRGFSSMYYFSVGFRSALRTLRYQCSSLCSRQSCRFLHVPACTFACYDTGSVSRV